MASGNDIINITMATSKKKTSSSKSSGVIKDPVTGNQYKKDSSGTYKPYTASSSSSSSSKNTSSSSSKNTSSTSSSKNTSSSSKSTPKVSYEQASKNLASGGLSGATLAAAQASLKNSYGNTSTPTQTPASNLPASVIKDPVTGNQYSKDASGTYVPYTGSTGNTAPTESNLPAQESAMSGAPALVNTADEYLKSYLESLKPSKSEDNYQQQLDNLIAQQSSINASRDLGIQEVNEQPIAMPFISGQGAAITNRAAVQSGALSAQAVPLQQSLAREQARRQSAMDVSKTMIDYASSKDKITNDYNQTNYNNANKASNLDTSVIEVGGKKKLINNQTGEVISELGTSSSGSGGSSSGTTTTLSGLIGGKTFVSGNFSYPASNYKSDKAELVSTRGQDNWVDPAAYIAGYNNWLANGGVKSDFLEIYPIKDYINPENTWPEIVALGGGKKPSSAGGRSK